MATSRPLQSIGLANVRERPAGCLAPAAGAPMMLGHSMRPLPIAPIAAQPQTAARLVRSC